MRRFALAAVATVAGFGVAAACGDPYDSEASPPSAGLDATTTTDAATETSTTEDASMDAADAAPDVDPCTDRDNDGFLARECEGGVDCDDDDDRAYPDAGFSTDPPTAVTIGNWNCDTEVSRKYPANFKCSDYTSNGLGGCTQQGFAGDPACGESGDYVTCKPGAPFSPCVQDTVAKLVQACR